MLRVALDCRTLQSPGGGIPRFVRSIITALKKEMELHLLFSNLKQVPDDLKDMPNLRIHAPSFHVKKGYLLWENLYLPKILFRIKPDIYHAPANDGAPPVRPRNTRCLVTIHDIIPARFPEGYSFSARFRWHSGTRLALRRADMIQVDSNYTKSEVTNYFHIHSKTPIVMHLSVDDVFSDLPLPDDKSILYHIGLKPPYIVYHGGFLPYKKVDEVIHSYDILCKQRICQPMLCLVGNNNNHFNNNLLPLIKKSPFNKYIYTPGRLTDRELAAILRNATCFVYLSSTEGFGYPPLEALACGAPVVCRQVGSLPECLGDAVHWVNEHSNTDDTANKIAEVIEMQASGHENSICARKQIQSFRGQIFKERIQNLYTTLLEMNPR